jgi:cobalt-zinc-cadmium efflux system membrane fusion protein
MKIGSIILSLWAAAALAVFADSSGAGDCDCPSCTAKKEGRFTLPALEGLQGDPQDVGKPDAGSEPAGEPAQAGQDSCCPADALSHEGHDHEEETDSHDHEAHGEHGHTEEADGHDDHGHAEEAGGVHLSGATGVEIHAAAGGTVEQTSVLPAEIKLNRDRTAAVSPRYPSVVRQVFAEIGDTVRRGDVLASLENRETMAVYTLSAPQDGIIITKDLAAGETAGAERVLYEVADLSSVWADISVFPRYRHLMRKGIPVRFISHDGHTAEGRIKYISPIISHETRTFVARCVLEHPGEDFMPGAFVRARVVLDRVDADVVVPRDAVQLLDGEHVVFVPDGHGYTAVPVGLGAADDRHIIITSGLTPGEDYVAAGAFVLKAAMVTSGMDPHAGHNH